MNLVELTQRFGTEAAARTYLEQIRWPDGVRCLRCGHDRVSRLAHQRKFECARCEYQFSVTVGTIFHRTRIGIRKWLIVIYMMMESKKGVSACQIQRMIGVSYPTAWYMCHHIRNAMKVGDTAEKLMGALEIDETYIGPKTDKRGRPSKDSPKVPVMGVIQRGGKVRVKQVKDVTSRTIQEFVNQWAGAEVEVIYTDEFRPYNVLRPRFRHERINHSISYVEGDIHTNGIENFWSLLKRGLIGSFHKVSVKHLTRYLDEFTFRFNERKGPELVDLVLGNCERNHMPYAELIA